MLEVFGITTGADSPAGELALAEMDGAGEEAAFGGVPELTRINVITTATAATTLPIIVQKSVRPRRTGSSDTIVPKSRPLSISHVGLCILRTVACRSYSPSKLDRLATLAAEDPHSRTPVKITHAASRSGTGWLVPN